MTINYAFFLNYIDLSLQVDHCTKILFTDRYFECQESSLVWWFGFAEGLAFLIIVVPNTDQLVPGWSAGWSLAPPRPDTNEAAAVVSMHFDSLDMEMDKARDRTLNWRS